MPIFVIYNNISAFFVHKIEKSPIQLAIFDIFRSHFVWLSTLIINTLYMWFCTSYIGIMYKFLYKRSLYSEIPAVYAAGAKYLWNARILARIAISGCHGSDLSSGPLHDLWQHPYFSTSGTPCDLWPMNWSKLCSTLSCWLGKCSMGTRPS